MSNVQRTVSEAIQTVEQVLSSLKNLQAALDDIPVHSLKTPSGRLTELGRKELDSMLVQGRRGSEIARYLAISRPAVTNRRRLLEKQGILQRA